MTRLTHGLRTTFVALEERNFRLFFFGQLVSTTGSWMQMVAQSWLVLELTGSGTMLGLVMALQWTPLLLFGAWGGVLADRYDKRKLILAMETIAGLLALGLGLLVLTDVVSFWMVLVVAGMLGCTQAIEQPARQSFVSELVGPERLTNALSLCGLLINVGRLLGPAIAGLVIAVAGVPYCFLLNAATYVPAVTTLALISSRSLYKGARAQRAKGQLTEGLRYVRRTPALWVPLLMMLAIGTFTYEFQITLPLLTSDTFGVDAAAYGLMQTMLGAGAIVGGIWVARRSVPTNAMLTGSAAVFGLIVLALSVAPTYLVAMVIVPFQGAANITFSTLANSSMQLSSASAMRSRVMALFSMAWVGTTPIGGPIVGWIAQTWSPRWALALGAFAAIGAAGLAWARLRHEPDPSTGLLEHHLVPDAEPAEPSELVDPSAGTDNGAAALRPQVA